MLRVVSRHEWMAEPPKQPQPLIFPVRSVVFHYTETEKCLSSFECIRMVQKLQLTALEKGLSDIPYNFIVTGDLHIYEGRGWEHRVFDRKLIMGYTARSSDDDQLIDDMNNLTQQFLGQNCNKINVMSNVAHNHRKKPCTHGEGSWSATGLVNNLMVN